MIYGFYESAAGMMTNEYRQNTLANNIANADTVGFKRDIATFAQRLTATEEGQHNGPSADWLSSLSGGVWLGATQTDYSEGPFIRTDAPTDAALSGSGFFVVEQDGRPLYTRDGRFQMDIDGSLRAATDGARVLGITGTPIIANPRGGTPSFDEEGFVLQDGAVIGRLALADFPDYNVLRKSGAGRFDAGDAQPTGSLALVKAGFVEGSGSSAITNMTEMIEASRSYQMNARMVQLQDESAARVISVIAQG
ncbi:MAG: flagellar hook-basal body protein [Phycisphaerae bacterium]